jgi:hypothetical protein
MSAASGRRNRLEVARAMPRNLALPRPRISAQLYIAIVLTVAVMCGLAGVSIKFAGETIAAAQRIHVRGLEPIVLLARAQVA